MYKWLISTWKDAQHTNYSGNVNKKHSEMPPSPTRMATTKKKKHKGRQGCGEIGTVDENVRWYSCHGKYYSSSSKK